MSINSWAQSNRCAASAVRSVRELQVPVNERLFAFGSLVNRCFLTRRQMFGQDVLDVRHSAKKS